METLDTPRVVILAAPLNETLLKRMHELMQLTHSNSFRPAGIAVIGECHRERLTELVLERIPYRLEELSLNKDSHAKPWHKFLQKPINQQRRK